MKKPLLYLWILSLFTVSIVIITPVHAQSTTIGVEPASIVDPGLGPGSTFTVEIWIRDVEDLAGPEFKLGYDTTVLTATLIEYGDIFGPTYFPLISEINDAEGWLLYGIMEEFGEPGFTGDGRLAIITFSVDDVGACVLDLYETKLGDDSPVPNPIIHVAEDGFFTNEAVHDIAVTPDLEVVDIGDSVTINVTVTNEGDFSETFSVKVYADLTAYNYTYDALGRLVHVEIVVGDEITVDTQTVADLASGATTTATFTWDTAGVEEGNHTISAEAVLDLDDDTRNNLFIDGGVIVAALPAHDIAVTNVIADPTEVDIGDSVTIDVTVTNEGDFNETFSVTVYYDTITIDTETDVSLENGTSTTLTFTWDTTGVEKGTYTIKAEASVVTGETDTADNTKDDVTVKVEEEAPALDILIYVAVAAAAIVVIVAAVIYFVKIRK